MATFDLISNHPSKNAALETKIQVLKNNSIIILPLPDETAIKHRKIVTLNHFFPSITCITMFKTKLQLIKTT